MNLTKKQNESLKKERDRQTKITLACEQAHLYEATNTQGNHRELSPKSHKWAFSRAVVFQTVSQGTANISVTVLFSTIWVQSTLQDGHLELVPASFYSLL